MSQQQPNILLKMSEDYYKKLQEQTRQELSRREREAKVIYVHFKPKHHGKKRA